MSSTIQIRVDDELKMKSDQLFKDLGTDTTTAIRMFLTQAVANNGFPFEIKRIVRSPYSPMTEEEILEKLEKSRESKDLATLDSLVSGVSTAIANDPSISGSGTLNISGVTSGASGLEGAVYQQLGDISKTTMVSSAGKSGTLTVQYTIGGATASSVRAYVAATGTTVTDAADCKYTKDDNGKPKALSVSNGQ